MGRPQWSLSQALCRAAPWDNSYNMNQGRFQQDTMKVLTVRVIKHWRSCNGKAVESLSLKVLSTWQSPEQPGLTPALTLLWAELEAPWGLSSLGRINGSISSGIIGNNWTSPHLRKTKHEEFLVCFLTYQKCSHFVQIKKWLTWHRLFESVYRYFEMSWILKEARLKTRFLVE